MEYLQEISNFLHQHQTELFMFARVSALIAIVSMCFMATFLVIGLPVRIRLGMVRIDPLIKLVIAGSVLAWMMCAGWVVMRFEFVIIAKLIILNALIVGSIFCWILLLAGPSISKQLTVIQQECELATNLTFLQAEMARSQLESLHERIQRSIQPEEREITETMLKTISPLVSLFLRKERSVMKWSIAAVDVGKTMMQYFWSDKK